MDNSHTCPRPAVGCTRPGADGQLQVQQTMQIQGHLGPLPPVRPRLPRRCGRAREPLPQASASSQHCWLPAHRRLLQVPGPLPVPGPPDVIATRPLSRQWPSAPHSHRVISGRFSSNAFGVAASRTAPAIRVGAVQENHRPSRCGLTNDRHTRLLHESSAGPSRSCAICGQAARSVYVQPRCWVAPDLTDLAVGIGQRSSTSPRAAATS